MFSKNVCSEENQLKDKNKDLCRPVIKKLNAFGQNPLARELSLLLLEASEKGCGKVVFDIVQKGGLVNTRDKFANTPLIRASESGHLKIVKFLESKGANLEHLNLRGKTALLQAIKKNRKKIVKYLLSKNVDTNTRSLDNETPLSAASFNGNLNFVKLLLKKNANPNTVDETGKSAIIYASAKGFYDIVEILIQNGVDANKKHGNDLTPLIWAAGSTDDTPQIDAVKTLQVLIDNNAQIDHQDNLGMSALMYAAKQNSLEITKFLVESGANKNLKNNENKKAIELTKSKEIKLVLE